MEYMYTQVKMHLKSGILASIWYCKMQGSQSFLLDPHQGSALDPPGARQCISREVMNIANFGHE